jgi:hypothetical protein
MTEDRTDSLAKNEALYRRVNERIESISDTIPRNERTMDFVCECDRRGCFEKVTAKRAEYEAVRAVGTHFIVHHGHLDPKVEHVVFSTDRFAVVEKEGKAAREALAPDPRG